MDEPELLHYKNVLPHIIEPWYYCIFNKENFLYFITNFTKKTGIFWSHFLVFRPQEFLLCMSSTQPTSGSDPEYSQVSYKHQYCLSFCRFKPVVLHAGGLCCAKDWNRPTHCFSNCGSRPSSGQRRRFQWTTKLFWTDCPVRLSIYKLLNVGVEYGFIIIGWNE